MASYNTSEFKSGLKVMLDNDPGSIIENEFVKPGKGQAFNRVKIRNLKTGRVIDVEMVYLYCDGEFWHFMVNDTFEQHVANETAVGDSLKWLKDQSLCTVTLWNGSPLSVAPPNFVNLKIVETDPGLRGDTSGGGGKPATLETGAVVRVPLFVQVGEVIKVDTRVGEYISRAKED